MTSVTVVSGPTGGTVTVNPDGTIDWALPTTPGTYTFTYEVCNLNPHEVRCDTAVVTATVEEPSTTTTTEPSTTTTTEPSTTTTTEPTTTTTEPSTTTTTEPTTTTTEPTTTTTEPQGEPVADLELDKQVEPTSGPVGQRFTYTLVYRNLGPDPATDVVVTDTIPAGLAIISASPGCSVDGQVVTCLDAGPLVSNPSRDPSADRAFEIVVEATIDGVFVNDAAVTGAQGDPEVGNNRDQETVTVTPQSTTTVASEADPDLALTKTVDVTTGPVGRTFTYVLAWVNLGPEPAEGVIVVDQLPDGLVLVSADPGCTAVGQVVTCTVPGVVAPGTSGSFTLSARATRGGEFVNRAFVASSTADQNSSNDVGTATVTAVPTPLPATGAQIAQWAWWATALAASGAAVALAARRPVRR